MKNSMRHIEELLGRSFNCECGRKHHVPIQQVVIADDAMERMSEFVTARMGEFIAARMGGFVGRPKFPAGDSGLKALLVADRNTYAVAGEAAREALERAGCDVDVLILGKTDGSVGSDQSVRGNQGAGCSGNVGGNPDGEGDQRAGCNDDAGDNQNTAGDHNVLEADEEAIRKVLARLSDMPALAYDSRARIDFNDAAKVGSSRARYGFAIAVGSGTINDITKYASFKASVPYIGVPTAPSMDGYTSSVAALLLGGFKKTLPAAPPLAVFADLSVLARAPSDMIAAGYGDLLGKLTAGSDWVLSKLVNSEYYCEFAANIARSIAFECLEKSAEIKARTKAAIKSLTEGLVWSGIAMLMVGNSRPASGAEHHISHYWEMKSLREGRPQPFHGVKVGVAAVLVAKLYREVLKLDPGSFDLSKLKERHPSREEREVRIRRFYGPLAEDAIAETAGKYLSWEEREAKLREVFGRWDEIVAMLRKIAPDPKRVRHALAEAGAPCTPDAIGFSRGWVWEALTNAKDLRMRFTVLDFADLLGCLDQIVEHLTM
ncbi:MAG: sn-glycerol-1-phosphate dehydrogenase [Firmicutes bacterium]|nr:sn-glycerol-1-phosphate dehydrogenase [Bacillota bacterium]